MAAVLLGLAFSGSSERLAEGVQIAGVEVGGLTPGEARALLEGRSAALEHDPVTFVSGTRRWRLTPAQLGLEVDWSAAVAAARREGEGFAPVRGLRRLQTRVFGADVAPPASVFDPALRYALDRFSQGIDRPPYQAAIRLRGLTPVLVPGRAGRALDRSAAERLVVRSLAAFSRSPVGLPVRIEPATVTAAELRPVVRQVRTAVSAPVRLTIGPTRWRIPRWRIAELLALPRDGARELAVAGPGARRYLARLRRAVETPPRDASFTATNGGRVRVVPAAAGVRLDADATARSLLAAALRPTGRQARAELTRVQPLLTTAAARGLGVTHVLSAFSTAYAGTADRIHNLQLAVSLLDGSRVAPGATFSFNGRVGERTAERGFRSAPVIVDDEYEEGIGGGVSQVATTVFNAAWEAGLKITTRAPHALYISRYPLGRDATVNFPDLDLHFVNDTPRWLVLRAWSGSSGITVAIYGPATGRRVESSAGPLVTIGPGPVTRVEDPTLPAGRTVREEEGAAPTSVRVLRTVYEADGTIRSRETWTTTYRGEKAVLRVGTKPRPKPPPKDEKAPATTGTTPETKPSATTTAEKKPAAPPPPLPPPGPQLLP